MAHHQMCHHGHHPRHQHRHSTHCNHHHHDTQFADDYEEKSVSECSSGRHHHHPRHRYPNHQEKCQKKNKSRASVTLSNSTESSSSSHSSSSSDSSSESSCSSSCSSSSKSSFSKSSFSSSSSSTSRTSCSSESSLDKTSFCRESNRANQRPLHSQSCVDISRRRRSFDNENDGNILSSLDRDGQLKNSKNMEKSLAAKERSGGSYKKNKHCKQQSGVNNYGQQRVNAKESGNIRKTKSMEVLSNRADTSSAVNLDEKALEKRKQEAHKNFVKEKMKFSAFLNEITLQVLSPSRLTSLGVTNVQRPTSPGQTSTSSKAMSPKPEPKKEKKPKTVRSRAGSNVSTATTQSTTHSQLSKLSHTCKPSHSRKHSKRNQKSRKTPDCNKTSYPDKDIIKEPRSQDGPRHQCSESNSSNSSSSLLSLSSSTEQSQKSQEKHQIPPKEESDYLHQQLNHKSISQYHTEGYGNAPSSTCSLECKRDHHNCSLESHHHHFSPDRHHHKELDHYHVHHNHPPHSESDLHHAHHIHTESDHHNNHHHSEFDLHHAHKDHHPHSESGLLHTHQNHNYHHPYSESNLHHVHQDHHPHSESDHHHDNHHSKSDHHQAHQDHHHHHPHSESDHHKDDNNPYLESNHHQDHQHYHLCNLQHANPDHNPHYGSSESEHHSTHPDHHHHHSHSESNHHPSHLGTHQDHSDYPQYHAHPDTHNHHSHSHSNSYQHPSSSNNPLCKPLQPCRSDSHPQSPSSLQNQHGALHSSAHSPISGIKHHSQDNPYPSHPESYPHHHLSSSPLDHTQNNLTLPGINHPHKPSSPLYPPKEKHHSDYCTSQTKSHQQAHYPDCLPHDYNKQTLSESEPSRHHTRFNEDIYNIRHSPVGHRSLSPHSTKSDSSASSTIQDDQSTVSYQDSSSFPKDKNSELDKLMMLKEQNEVLHHSLLQTTVRMECMGSEFKTGHQLLESELQRTRLELNTLLEHFTKLQDNYSCTQQNNHLLEKKLHCVAQCMDGERERLNQRISELTEQLSAAKTTIQSLETINVSSVLQEVLVKHLMADDLMPSHSVAPPPAEFMTNDSFDKASIHEDDQSLGTLQEEEESDWSEMGEEAHNYFLRSSQGNPGEVSHFQWQQRQVPCDRVTQYTKCNVDTESESGGEETICHPHGLQIPHLKFTVHPETLPVPITDVSLARFKQSPDGPACDIYQITEVRTLGSPIRVLSASLEEIHSIGLEDDDHVSLKSNKSMMDLHQTQAGARQVSNEVEIVSNWIEVDSHANGENINGLVGLESAQKMLNHFIHDGESTHL